MADTVVERRPSARFFCHRCNIEFEDVLQDYICPYCASGFIEQLESETEGSVLSADDVSDADISNLDDSDDLHQTSSHPVLNDLAFLVTGGRIRGGRPESLLEHLMLTVGGGALGGAITAGAPFVLVGAPGDYVFGGEGLDAVVTQLLGQLENTGPPPLPREQIAAIPSEVVSAERAAANVACSICWDNFQEGEKVSRLECEHIFHSTCIEPWLQLHATCPICRRSLLPETPPAPAAPAVPTSAAPAPAPPPSGQPRLRSAGATAPQVPEVRFDHQPFMRSVNVTRALLRRLPHPLVPQSWQAPASGSSSASVSTASSVTAGGVWAPRSDAASTNSSNSLGSERDRTSSYNMDIDYD